MSAHEPASWIGRTIDDKLVVESRLGGGAMGDVYLAWHQALEKHVAIKVLHPALATDPLFVGRFRREAMAAGRLDHPGCVRVYDFGYVDALPYLAMEYVPGSDLHQHLRALGPLSAEAIVDLMSQALEGVAAAHDAGIVHRDLKPENLLVLTARGDAAPVLKVCDFGIAQLSLREGRESDDALTSPGVVMGTPEYMAPEQARAEAVDERADVYALGIVLYQLLAGRPPFSGASPVAILMRHLDEAPLPPDSVRKEAHAGLAAVAMKAISKHPAHRYGSARDMLAALRVALTEPAPPTFTVRTRLPARARSVGWMVAAATAVCTVGLGVVSFEPRSADATARVATPAPVVDLAPMPSAGVDEREDSARRELEAWYVALSEASTAAPVAGGAARRPPAKASASRGAAAPRSTQVRSYYDVADATPAGTADGLASR